MTRAALGFSAMILSGCWVSFMGGAPVSVTGAVQSSSPSGAWCAESEDVQQLRADFPDSCEIRCRGDVRGFQCEGSGASVVSASITKVAPALFAISTTEHDNIWIRSEIATDETVILRSAPRWQSPSSVVSATAREIVYQPMDGSAPSTVRYAGAPNRSWIVSPQMLWIDEAGAVCGRDVFAIEPGGAYYLDLTRAASSEIDVCFGS